MRHAADWPKFKDAASFKLDSFLDAVIHIVALGECRHMEEKQYLIDSLSIEESWRVFRIMAEFVEGIETLSEVHNAVTIFGSARVKPDDIYYQENRNSGPAFSSKWF